MKALALALVVLSCAFGVAQGPEKARGPMQAQSGAPAQVNAAKLAKLKTAYETAKAASAKKPKDAKLKKTYVDASVGYGLGCMYSELPPREKYTSALKYLREAVKVDPKNKIAKEQIGMIESIYKQMGRPVPKTD